MNINLQILTHVILILNTFERDLF